MQKLRQHSIRIKILSSTTFLKLNLVHPKNILKSNYQNNVQIFMIFLQPVILAQTFPKNSNCLGGNYRNVPNHLTFDYLLFFGLPLTAKKCIFNFFTLGIWWAQSKKHNGNYFRPVLITIWGSADCTYLTRFRLGGSPLNCYSKYDVPVIQTKSGWSILFLGGFFKSHFWGCFRSGPSSTLNVLWIVKFWLKCYAFSIF